MIYIESKETTKLLLEAPESELEKTLDSVGISLKDEDGYIKSFYDLTMEIAARMSEIIKNESEGK